MTCHSTLLPQFSIILYDPMMAKSILTELQLTHFKLSIKMYNANQNVTVAEILFGIIDDGSKLIYVANRK